MNMNKLYYFILGICMTTMFSCTSCNTSKTVEDDPNAYGVTVSSVKTMKPDTLTQVQRDSMFSADRLPVYAKWSKTYIKDADTNKAYEYATLYDKETGIIYTVKYLKDNNVYVIQKKKTK